MASIQPRTSLVKFARSPRTDPLAKRIIIIITDPPGARGTEGAAPGQASETRPGRQQAGRSDRRTSSRRGRKSVESVGRLVMSNDVKRPTHDVKRAGQQGKITAEKLQYSAFFCVFPRINIDFSVCIYIR